jgi:hypothetical protein
VVKNVEPHRRKNVFPSTFLCATRNRQITTRRGDVRDTSSVRRRLWFYFLSSARGRRCDPVRVPFPLVRDHVRAQYLLRIRVPGSSSRFFFPLHARWSAIAHEAKLLVARTMCGERTRIIIVITKSSRSDPFPPSRYSFSEKCYYCYYYYIFGATVVDMYMYYYYYNFIVHVHVRHSTKRRRDRQ